MLSPHWPPPPGTPEVARAPGRSARPTGLPECLVALSVAGGLALVAANYWRTGLAAVGLGLVAAAGFRLLLPPGAVPLLVNRTRPVDAAVLLALGGTVLGLAWQLVYAAPFR